MLYFSYKALKKSECYEKALESLLKSNGTHKWDLPKVYERLKKFGASLKGNYLLKINRDF